jgi:excisionase family DNA binding protein
MASRPDDEHPLMTIRAAAVALGCSDMTIRRRVEARQFPAVKIGSKALVPRAFVARLLADALAGRTVIVEEYAAAWSRAIAMAEAVVTERTAVDAARWASPAEVSGGAR